MMDKVITIVIPADRGPYRVNIGAVPLGEAIHALAQAFAATENEDPGAVLECEGVQEAELDDEPCD